MLFLGVLALRVTFQKFYAKLSFFSLKVTLSFCLNTESFPPLFSLYFHCFSRMSVSVLTTLCCKYEGSSLLLFQGRIFDYGFKNSFHFLPMHVSFFFFFLACLLCLLFFP